MKTRKPVVIHGRKEKGCSIPFDKFDTAKQEAEFLSKDTIGGITKVSRFAFIRIQKLEVV